MHFVLVLAMLIGTSFFWSIGATAAGFCWIVLWALAAVLWTRHAMRRPDEMVEGTEKEQRATVDRFFREYIEKHDGLS